jgi:D-alanine-D-alanine ligase
MRVGLTYDLREEYLREGYGEEETAEFDRPSTIEGIENALQDLGFATDRIGHVRQLAQRLCAGDRWDLVFNIAEGMYGIGREAQVPALLDAYNIPYTFSDAMVLGLTLHKGMTKHVVRDQGVATADFCLVQEPGDIANVRLPYPLFAKPVAEGTGKGIDRSSVIHTSAQLSEVCGRLLRVFKQPVLVETFLSGREFTVGIVGTGADARSIGTMEVVLKEKAEANVYSYTNKEFCEELVEYRLVKGPIADECAALSVKAWRALGCRDGGRIDVRCDGAGKPHFIEVNPLAGLNPVHSDLPIICTLQGLDYNYLIGEIMGSVLKRINAGAAASSGARSEALVQSMAA